MLGHFVLGRGEAVIECAVVGDQQHTGGVGIQTADGLRLADAKVVGQQAEYAGVIARFVRGFIAGGLVQQQIVIRIGNHDQRFAVTLQTVDGGGVDFGLLIVEHVSVNADQAVTDQPLALFAAAPALCL